MKVRYTDLETGEEVTEYWPIPGRGAIASFTPSSRKRLKKRLFAYEEDPKAMITLTYGKIYTADAEEWKRDLDRWCVRFLRTYPDIYMVWKLEPQKRGAPHFHVLIWVPWTMTKRIHRKMRNFISKTWNETIYKGHRSEAQLKNLKAGTQLKFLTNPDTYKKYLSKYVSKEVEGHKLPWWARPGRFWGERNKQAKPAVQQVTADLTTEEFFFLKRTLSKLQKARRKKAKRKKPFKTERLFRTNDNYLIFEDQATVMQILSYIQGEKQYIWEYFNPDDRSLNDVLKCTWSKERKNFELAEEVYV